MMDGLEGGVVTTEAIGQKEKVDPSPVISLSVGRCSVGFIWFSSERLM
jgi:hypothetical protein